MTHTTSLDIDPATPCICSDCEWAGPASDLKPIADLAQRVAPGETMPAGECPDCGCLAHIDPDEGKKTFTVEFSWMNPFVVQQEIMAATAEEALAEAKRIFAEDEIEYDSQRECSDACTDTQITGLWEGGAYDGADLRPASDCLATDIAIAKNAAPLAVMPDNILAVMTALQAGRDALAEAMTTHIYDADNGEEPGPDCAYAAAIKQMDAALVGAVPPYRAADPWQDDPQFPAADWLAEVANGDTRSGYLDWVAAKRDAAKVEG